MYLKQKYIRTKRNVIIVFPELLEHKDFIHFEPVSAGFISIGTTKMKDGDREYSVANCSCYGESVSLGLKSHESDTARAKTQILGITD